MRSLRIRRALAVSVLAAVSLLLPLAELHAAPRAESRWERSDRAEQVVRRGFASLWSALVGIWEEAGLRIDDNG
jgi:hypothetical protein